jgi:DNA-binding HxlR family transcriptional regulator
MDQRRVTLLVRQEPGQSVISREAIRALTDDGRTFRPIIAAMAAWGEAHGTIG